MHALTRLLIAAALAVAAAASQAQSPVRLNGPTLDGQAFSLDSLRGRVVLLFFWNTDCAPCIQKMPELRANAMGWRGKPFTLVLVSTDKDREAALSYLRTLRQVEKDAPPMPALWAGQQHFGGGLTAPAAVPLTLVVDAQGRIAARHAGRIAPEAWDDVAGLLP